MTQEEEFVVNPLVKYFGNHGRSGAGWSTRSKPKFGSSATGWDLEVERKNQVLLIEAKYIRGAFASAFAGLVIAPLSKRPEKMKSGKYRSWASVVCWAIGWGHKEYKNDIYQILLDYLSRNLKFWEYYSKTLKVKYIYFVNNKKVAKINFDKIIKLSNKYKSSANQSQPERIKIAKKLLKNHLKFK